MRSLLFAVSLSLALLPCTISVAAGSWLVPQHDAQATNADAGATVLDGGSLPRRVWFVRRVTQAIAADRFVYAVRGQDVVVLDAVTGRLLRTFPPAQLHLGAGNAPHVLAYAAGKLVIATNSAIIAADPFHGTLVWRVAFAAMFLAIERSVIYAGGSHLSAALDLRTGRVLWRHDGFAGSQPALIAGYLYQSAGAETRILDPATGAQVASLGVQARWTGDSKNAFAMVAQPVPKLSWLARMGANGQPVWRVDLGHLVAGASGPVYALHTLYAASDRFHPGIVSVAASNGSLRWARNLGSNLSMVMAGHRLAVLHRQSGQIEVLDPASGRTVRRFAVPGYTVSSSATLMAAGPALYVTDGAGLVAFRSR